VFGRAFEPFRRDSEGHTNKGMAPLRTPILILIVVFSFVGCAKTPQGTGARAISRTAKVSYDIGLDELSRGNYTEAIHHFQTVAKSPRYVKWSSLAKLRLADCLFFQQHFGEAAQQYLTFINQFRGDHNIPYAQYMIGVAYFEQIPSDLFFLPPPYERDRAALKKARSELTIFVETFPRSKYLEEGRKKLAQVIDLQFSYNDYVARYYESREQPGGTIVRLQHALEAFPARANTADTYLRLGKAYVATDRVGMAYVTYQTFLNKFPEDVHVADVRSWLNDLQSILEERGAETPVPSPETTPDS
jgi:outer membrane protein assembly factor BamD